MRIAFLIMASPEYRVYGPVVEAALARGWSVECWHDHSRPRDGLKGYQFPSLESVPVFRNGRPVIRSYHGQAELRGWLQELRTDAVIAWQTAEAAAGTPLPSPRPFWVAQQYSIDSFTAHGPDSLRSCDFLALYSRWWLEWAGRYFQAERAIADSAAYVRELESRTAFVGMPEMDVAPQIDPVEVRQRWGIPANRPVVVLFVFPQGVGRNAFWPQQICAEPNRLKQVFNIVRRQRFEYWPHVRRGWNDRNVVRAIRQFCDRSGAYLLVKARRKTPVPAYTKAVADLCLYDECAYPATVLEALSVASLSIGYYTTSVFESVSLGVPHLCLTYPSRDYNGVEANYFSSFYTSDEGGAFQYRGVSTAWSIPEALARIPASGLGDFAIDPAARSRYIRTFLSEDDGDAGERTIAAIERAMAERVRTA